MRVKFSAVLPRYLSLNRCTLLTPISWDGGYQSVNATQADLMAVLRSRLMFVTPGGSFHLSVFWVELRGLTRRD